MEVEDLLDTKHLYADQPESIIQTANYVRTGQLVVIPTDTVYGVGCLAFDPTAIGELYRVKQRPFHKAIPILLADTADLEKVVKQLPVMAEPFIEKYWPGPLTIVLPRHDSLPNILSLDDTIAVRIPDHDAARAVIRCAGGAMAVTSANLSGQAAAPTAEQALTYLSGQVAVVLDDGPSPKAQASTVIDCTGRRPVILREGPVSLS